MTTAADGRFGPIRRRRPLFDTAMFLGHHGFWILPVFFPVVMLLSALKWWGVDLPALNVIRSVLGDALIVVLSCEVFVHDRNLCLRDMRRTPVLNPQRAVEKNDFVLKFFHRRVWRWIAVGLAAGAVFVPITSGGSLPLYLRIALLALAVVGVGVAVLVLHSVRVHGNLQPWCPYCDHGGGGGESAPVPTPDPAGTASR